MLVKGKTRPVGLYALAGDAALAASDEFADLNRLHAAMLAAYREPGLRRRDLHGERGRGPRAGCGSRPLLV